MTVRMSGGVWLSGDVWPAARQGGGMAGVEERRPGAAVRSAPATTFDRQPPQDLAAEQTVVLGAGC